MSEAVIEGPDGTLYEIVIEASGEVTRPDETEEK
jgi:hypothetical protein